MRDEVVLITGGSSGIGLAAAHLFAAEGARVILAARDEDKLARAASAIGGDARALAADATSPEAVQALVADIESREGRLDVLINSAGQFEVGPAEQGGAELAERLIRVNYLGPVRFVHQCLPLLRRGSRRSIVNISSLAGKLAPPFMAAYSGSKFALAGYTHALRQELRPEGFHVCLVSPGPVDTPLIEGRIRTTYYPVPPGVPVVSAEAAAVALMRAVKKRSAEVVIPRRLGPVVRMGQSFPRLVDLLYRVVARPGPSSQG
jgi:NAD(P)-dependent dehydrogenase (short-subunit alcohol dehydrogenase family)